jgi:hypothetical protein
VTTDVSIRLYIELNIYRSIRAMLWDLENLAVDVFTQKQ